MSTIFSLLKCTQPAKVWNDETFEALYNNQKCYDFFDELSRDKAPWILWSDFIERKKLAIDFKVEPAPNWLKWLHHNYADPSYIGCLGMSPAVINQFAKFKEYYDAKLAEEDRLRWLEEQKRRNDWQLRKMEIDAANDSSRIAHQFTLSDEDLRLLAENKKDAASCKHIVKEVPFDTTKAEIKVIDQFDKPENDRSRKVVDLLVICTNFGVTYSAEDIAAINTGRKRREKCKTIVKAFPVPEITIDEEAKKAMIHWLNDSNRSLKADLKCFYARSDQALISKAQSAKPARMYMRRPKASASESTVPAPPPPASKQ